MTFLPAARTGLPVYVASSPCSAASPAFRSIAECSPSGAAAAADAGPWEALLATRTARVLVLVLVRHREPRQRRRAVPQRGRLRRRSGPPRRSVLRPALPQGDPRLGGRGSDRAVPQGGLDRLDLQHLASHRLRRCSPPRRRASARSASLCRGHAMPSSSERKGRAFRLPSCPRRGRSGSIWPRASTRSTSPRRAASSCTSSATPDRRLPSSVPDEIAQEVCGNRELGEGETAGGDLLDASPNAFRLWMSGKPSMDGVRLPLCLPPPSPQPGAAPMTRSGRRPGRSPAARNSRRPECPGPRRRSCRG